MNCYIFFPLCCLCVYSDDYPAEPEQPLYDDVRDEEQVEVEQPTYDDIEGATEDYGDNGEAIYDDAVDPAGDGAEVSLGYNILYICYMHIIPDLVMLQLG